MRDKTHLVIFDFDGVIVDSIGVMIEGMRRFYPKLTREMFVEASHKSIEDRDKKFEETIKRHKPTKKEEAEYQKKKMTHAPMHRGMKTVLKDVHEHYYVALNTNASPENCTPLLEKFGIKKYFDAIETGGDGKSKIDKNESIMSELGVTPIEALFVTDTAGDVLDAEEAGVPSIGVTWGVHTRDDFESGEIGDGIIAIVDSAEELYDAILEHFKR